MTIIAAIGANALWMLYAWLLSAIICSELARRKGFQERLGLGSGLLLSVLGIVLWLVVPARPDSRWARRRQAAS